MLAVTVLLGFCCLISTFSVNGAPSDVPCRFDGIPNGSLSLARAVDLALCSNADIQSAAATVRVRAAQLGEAHAEYWPTLTATATELRENTRYPGAPIPSSTDTAVTAYGALSWRLFDFGGRHADSRSASMLLEVALGTQDATIQKVLGAVVEAYFDAVTAKALMNSKAEDEALARETLASAERRLRQGDGAQSDALQAKTASVRATLDSNRAQGSYETSLAVLAYSVGLRTGTPYTVPDEADRSPGADDKSLQAWLDDARQRHPAIAAARADVEAAEAQVVSARSSGRPTVDFQANYYANGFPEQGIATTRQRSTTVGIAITIPLFDGFLSRYKVHEAEATVKVKEAALIDVERVTLTDIVKAYSDATTAVANLRESQSLLEAAKASQASSKRRYESGATDILELLNTQTALADARQERVRCLADWRSARLRLLATSGILSKDI
ncbi:MAG: TolC family protein [Steroidobacteraceae bacterium]